MTERKQSLKGNTYQYKTGCGHIYVTINEDNDSIFEIFSTIGKSGGCASSQCEAIGRVISVAIQSGTLPERIAKQLTGISCHSPCGVGEKEILSCADAIGKAIILHKKSKIKS